MNSESEPILGAAKSASPAGVGGGPTPLDGMLSRAPFWYKGDAIRVEYGRLLQLRKEAADRLLVQIEKLRQARERAASGPSAGSPGGQSGARAPGGGSAPVSGGAPAPKTVVKVLGYIYMGELLDPAVLASWSAPLPETEFEGEGFNPWSTAVAVAEKHVVNAKDDLETIDLQLDEILVTLGTELGKLQLGMAAQSQMWGNDSEADAQLEDAKQLLREKLARLVEKHGRSDGELKDSAAVELLNGIAEGQALLDGDDPVMRDLQRVLRRHAEFGEMLFVDEPESADPRLHRVYVVRPVPGRDGSRTHTVTQGQTLSAIARKYYGDPNEWRRIFEANRPLLKDPRLIMPGWKLIIPPKK